MTTSAVLEVLREYLAGDAPHLTLPAEAYRDPELFELEADTIFRRSWIVATHASAIGPGQYVTVNIAGEPVIVVRDKAGVVRALSAVCRHRFMPLTEAPQGTTRMFECPYHRWTYNLDGTLKGAPFMRDNLAFAACDIALPQFRVEEWQGLVFVNLDNEAAALGPQLDTPAERVARHKLADATQVFAYEGTWAANWKVILENVSEAYHHFGLHPETVNPTAPTKLATSEHEAEGVWVLFRTPLSEAAAPPTVLELTEDDLADTQFVNVLPALNFFTVGEVTMWFSYLPAAVDQTHVRCGVLLPSAIAATDEGAALAEQLGRFVETINVEDQAGVEAVQRGLTSRFTTRGHLSPMEGAVVAFYRYLARTLVAS